MHDVVRDVAKYIASKVEHNFMVSHDVNSEEFPRKDSYEQYSHMSIVANKFAELPSPIICPKLKILMLKLYSKKEFKLQEDFFDRMVELNVLSLSGHSFWKDIFKYQKSLPKLRTLPIQRLSSLRTLRLSDLCLDDISIIGELVTLEVLSIRDCRLEELPVEIGKLTNLIMLELFIFEGVLLKRISVGVLSRLVRLEELHVVGVEYSYSTMRELDSLSRLTALSLSYCSEDVIYKNMGLPSKLTWYALTVGSFPRPSLIMDNYDKAIALTAYDTAPLGDWIRQLLKESEFVHSYGKGSNNVLSELHVNDFQNVKCLRLKECDSVTHLLKRTHEVIKFPIYVSRSLNIWDASLTFAMTMLRALSSLGYGKCTSVCYQSSKISGRQPTTPSIPQILLFTKRFLVPTWNNYTSGGLTT